MTTSVNFLLDRTYSMQGKKTETVGAFNEYVDTLAADFDDGADPDKIFFTLATFDTISMDKICVGVPVKEAPRLTLDAQAAGKSHGKLHLYVPRDNTNLFECVVKFIRAVESKQREEPTDRVVVVFQTDGEENASPVEYKPKFDAEGKCTFHPVKSLVAEKQAQGWQFVFMGVGIDAYAGAASVGIGAATTIQHGLSGQHTNSAYQTTASNTRLFASGAVQDMNYTGMQKAAAGDPTAQLSGPKTKPKSTKASEFKL